MSPDRLHASVGKIITDPERNVFGNAILGGYEALFGEKKDDSGEKELSDKIWEAAQNGLAPFGKKYVGKVPERSERADKIMEEERMKYGAVHYEILREVKSFAKRYKNAESYTEKGKIKSEARKYIKENAQKDRLEKYNTYFQERITEENIPYEIIEMKFETIPEVKARYFFRAIYQQAKDDDKRREMLRIAKKTKGVWSDAVEKEFRRLLKEEKKDEE